VCGSSNPGTLERSRRGSVILSSSKKRDSVCVHAKSPGRYISSGALSREVGGALESALEIVEAIVGGG
jgi:hypothetical protein